MTDADQSGTNFSGSIYITLTLPAERTGGAVASTGDAIAHWIGTWLARPEQADNLRKLRSAEGAERHVFVLLRGFTTASFAVVDPLMRSGGPLPTVDPELPSPVTHVWVMSTWSAGDGFRWSADSGWIRFAKVL